MKQEAVIILQTSRRLGLPRMRRRRQLFDDIGACSVGGGLDDWGYPVIPRALTRILIVVT